MLRDVGRLVVIATLSALAAALPASTSASSTKPPTAEQLSTAVRAAEQSHTVWATVDICNTRLYPHTIGIRGQMPALGFSSQLSMTFQVDYWAGAKRGFVPDPHVSKTAVLGTFSTGLHQRGYNFRFDPPAYLSGQITFRWRIGSRVIGQTTHRTRSGVKGVDFGDPRGHSAARCRMRH